MPVGKEAGKGIASMKIQTPVRRRACTATGAPHRRTRTPVTARGDPAPHAVGRHRPRHCPCRADGSAQGRKASPHRRGGGLARRCPATASMPCTWVRYAHSPRSPRWRSRIASGSRVGGVKASRAPPSTAPWYAATASPARTPRCAASSQASRPLTRKSPPCSSSTPARRRRSTSARVPRSSKAPRRHRQAFTICATLVQVTEDFQRIETYYRFVIPIFSIHHHIPDDRDPRRCGSNPQPDSRLFLPSHAAYAGGIPSFRR